MLTGLALEEAGEAFWHAWQPLSLLLLQEHMKLTQPSAARHLTRSKSEGMWGGGTGTGLGTGHMGRGATAAPADLCFWQTLQGQRH